MKRLVTSTIALVVCALVFDGCIVVSLSPWFAQSDIVAADDLVGHWLEDKGHTVVSISKGKVSFWGNDVDGYIIAQTKCPNGEKNRPMIAVAGKVGEKRYLMVSTRPDHEPGPWFAAQLHLIFTYEIKDGGLELQGISPDWLEREYAKHRFGLDFVCFDDDSMSAAAPMGDPCTNSIPLLTGSTAVLSDFLAKNAGDSAVFDRVARYRQVESPKCEEAPPKEK